MPRNDFDVLAGVIDKASDETLRKTARRLWRVHGPIDFVRPGLSGLCISCPKFGKRGSPWGGGGYFCFRILPYSAFRRGMKRSKQSGQPCVFYIQPREIDAQQPRVRGLGKSHYFRHHVNINKGEQRFANLLRDFPWTTMADLLGCWRSRNTAGHGDAAPDKPATSAA